MPRPLIAMALLLVATGCDDASLPAHSMTFELRLVARAGESGAAPRAVRSSTDTVLVAETPLLTGADLADARAVTRSAWYVLSGRHSTSQVVLTVNPKSCARWLEAARLAVSRGDRLALLLNNEVLGVIMVQQTPADNQFAIDASFFSTGTEPQKAAATTTLARQIRASLP